MANVVKGDFQQKVAKKSLAELCENVASAINLDSCPFRVAWPYLYHAIEPSPGVKLIVAEDQDQVLIEVPSDHVAHRVVAWMRLQQVPAWYLTLKRAREAVDYWRAIARSLDPDEVKMIRWQDEPGYTWHRMPWVKSAGPTPTWDTLMGRMTNATAFKAWVGSLFSDASLLQQYVWMYGLGADGKGAINRFFRKVFGQAYRSKQPPDRGDKFWSYNLIGARVVVFPDCNNRSFVASGLFKTLTGGDPVSVEAKGQMAFTAALNCKFVILSNEEPNISSEHADMRRIIYCEFGDRGEFDPQFEERLHAEGGAFLADCLETYQRLCPDHGPIPTEINVITDVVASNEEEFQVFFQHQFTVNNDYFVTPSIMQDALSHKWRDTGKHSAFRAWLRRTHGVRGKTVRIGNVPTWVYPGIEHRTMMSLIPVNRSNRDGL